jgi:hypothetical protein
MAYIIRKSTRKKNMMDFRQHFCDFRRHYVPAQDLASCGGRRICGACVGDWAMDLHIEQAEAAWEKSLLFCDEQA